MDGCCYLHFFGNYCNLILNVLFKVEVVSENFVASRLKKMGILQTQWNRHQTTERILCMLCRYNKSYPPCRCLRMLPNSKKCQGPPAWDVVPVCRCRCSTNISQNVVWLKVYVLYHWNYSCCIWCANRTQFELLKVLYVLLQGKESETEDSLESEDTVETLEVENILLQLDLKGLT